MSVCLCGLLVAALSAMGADLDTTGQFTERGYPELNPAARPFVEGSGEAGEATLAVMTGSVYVWLDRQPEPWRSASLGGAFAVHTAMSVRNKHLGGAASIPLIVFPVLTVTW